MSKKEEKNSTNKIELLKEIKVAYQRIENMLDNIENNDFKYFKVLNNIKNEIKNLYNITYEKMQNKEKEKLITSACCKNCCNNLLISDNIEYSYQCIKCDENFYDFETISEELWYKEKGKVTKELPSSFNIQIVYDKTKDLIHIGTDSSSGIKCKCKNIEDLIENIESYCNDFILEPEEKENEIC